MGNYIFVWFMSFVLLSLLPTMLKKSYTLNINMTHVMINILLS